ncbi:MAG: hypothetical protein NWR73_06595, partial [Flavobacteriales bacterium]|nr:hypothetical protein [Flavobacteriales bacterium]
MKKAFTFLLLTSIFHFASAQLVLTANNNPHTAPYEDIREIVEINIPAPQEGSNIVYDYSSLVAVDQDMIPYIPATREGFTDYDRFSYGFSSLGPVPLYSEYYTLKTAAGIQRTGSYKLPQNLSLELFTGSNLDSLIFPGNSEIFEDPVFDIQYPAAYASSWASDYTFTTNFNITVAAFGLNQVPGYQFQTVEFTMDVVGSGTLILPTLEGPSEPFDVLVFKDSRVMTDTIYLGGALAPAPLLDAFGLTQGQEYAQNRYFFYTENQERPLMVLNMSDDWLTVERCFFASEGITNSVATVENATFAKPFPNPVRQNEAVVFT